MIFRAIILPPYKPPESYPGNTSGFPHVRYCLPDVASPDGCLSPSIGHPSIQTISQDADVNRLTNISSVEPLPFVSGLFQGSLYAFISLPIQSTPKVIVLPLNSLQFFIRFLFSLILFAFIMASGMPMIAVFASEICHDQPTSFLPNA
jgi:hypothetical protein